jgi:hypothetical protein
MRRVLSILVILTATSLIVAGCTGRESNREESPQPTAESGNTQTTPTTEPGDNTDIPIHSGVSTEGVEDIDLAELPDFQVEEISSDEIFALNRAMDDEYKLRATYQKTLDTFGEVKPFAEIYTSTDRHVEALTWLFDRYQLEIPRDEWFEVIPEFNNVHEAYEECQAMEMQSAALYDELIGKVDNADIRFVFRELMRISTEKNIPELQRYIEGRIG